mmetsp:Transcript_3207/g.3486  ORF Transcript_3207/g.3486 Transcript_3207/m.3486 type:complete len:210 (-) Transcript_3207:299-928(-)
MYVRVEAFGHRLLELLHELLLVSSLHNILCHIFRLFEVLHNDVVVTVRGSGNGFLMSILPMNHTCLAGLTMRVHCIPHLTNPRAGCIDDLHPFLIECLQLFDRRSERWQNHHLITTNRTKVLFTIFSLIHKMNVHFLQTLIHLRIVNDFIRDMYFLIREMRFRFICHGDRSLDTPAEAEELSEPDSKISPLQHSLVTPQLCDQRRCKLL